MGLNVLKHTQHEPIGRLFVIEECWQKKYSTPGTMSGIIGGTTIRKTFRNIFGGG